MKQSVSNLSGNFKVNLDYSINRGQVFLWKKIDTKWYGVNGKRILVLENAQKFKKNMKYRDLVSDFVPYFTENIPSIELFLFALDIEVQNLPRQFPTAYSAQFTVSGISISTNRVDGYILYLIYVNHATEVGFEFVPI